MKSNQKSMSTVKSYIETNQARFLEELFSLIRIPSVSAKSEHKPDMLACAKRWAELLISSGADRAEVMPTTGNPVVYAERIISPEAKTVLVYSHYDVMPAEPLELWKSNPFEPEIRDGRIWARGADDDKGQGMRVLRQLYNWICCIAMSNSSSKGRKKLVRPVWKIFA